MGLAAASGWSWQAKGALVTGLHVGAVDTDMMAAWT
jgi:hypothetical protein